MCPLFLNLTNPLPILIHGLTLQLQMPYTIAISYYATGGPKVTDIQIAGGRPELSEATTARECPYVILLSFRL